VQGDYVVALRRGDTLLITGSDDFEVCAGCARRLAQFIRRRDR